MCTRQADDQMVTVACVLPMPMGLLAGDCAPNIHLQEPQQPIPANYIHDILEKVDRLAVCIAVTTKDRQDGLTDA